MRHIGNRPDELSRTDRIMKLHAKGLANWQIAERIGSNQKTVASLISYRKKLTSLPAKKE